MSWWKKNDNATSGSAKLDSPANTHNASAASTAPIRPVMAAPIVSEKALEERYGAIRSALGEGTVIQGKLSFDTPVRIDGNLSGDVFSSSVLIVGKTGKVSANLKVDTLIVFGSVSGEITAKNRIELHATAELVGDVCSPSFYVAEGAYFDGRCKMQQADGQVSNSKSKNGKLLNESKDNHASGIAISETLIAESSLN